MSDARAFHIRDAKSSDAAAITPLLDQLGFPALPDVVTSRLESLAQLKETVLVALDHASSDVVGFVSIHATPVLHRPTPVGRISALIVRADLRGQGLGRLLVAGAEERLVTAGCALIEITSNTKLADAHAFYQRLGYTITSHRFCKTIA